MATLEVEDDGTLLGINDRVQLADAELEMRLRINEAHMRAGVTMQDPASTFIDATVRIAADVTLEPGVILRGATVIERDAVIRAGSQIFDTHIGERTVVWASVLEGSVVEADVTIGPFSHVRKDAHIGANVQLGNYAEVKNSRIGAGTKSHHFSYLGDADVGERVNIGAGSITANYDGVHKHRTRIGTGAFIGSDTIMRAPVSIGEGAFTGAASLVTRDVPDGEVVLGVPARPYVRQAPCVARTDRPGGQPGSLMGSSFVEVLVIAVLIGVNAIFVAAEIALVTVRRSRIRQLTDEGDRRARRVARMIERPGRLLATIQLGITFIGFLAAAFAGASIAGQLADWFREVGPLSTSADVLALLVVTLAVSLVTIVFGELVPKTLALAHAERYALALARPVEVLGVLLAPLVWLLTSTTHFVTRCSACAT